MRKHFITLACALACNVLATAQEYPVESWNADSTVASIRLDENATIKWIPDPSDRSRFESLSYLTVKVFQAMDPISLAEETTSPYRTIAVYDKTLPYKDKRIFIEHPMLAGTYTYKTKAGNWLTVPIVVPSK